MAELEKAPNNRAGIEERPPPRHRVSKIYRAPSLLETREISALWSPNQEDSCPRLDDDMSNSLVMSPDMLLKGSVPIGASPRKIRSPSDTKPNPRRQNSDSTEWDAKSPHDQVVTIESTPQAYLIDPLPPGSPVKASSPSGVGGQYGASAFADQLGLQAASPPSSNQYQAFRPDLLSGKGAAPPRPAAESPRGEGGQYQAVPQDIGSRGSAPVEDDPASPPSSNNRGAGQYQAYDMSLQQANMSPQETPSLVSPAPVPSSSRDADSSAPGGGGRQYQSHSQLTHAVSLEPPLKAIGANSNMSQKMSPRKVPEFGANPSSQYRAIPDMSKVSYHSQAIRGRTPLGPTSSGPSQQIPRVVSPDPPDNPYQRIPPNSSSPPSNLTVADPQVHGVNQYQSIAAIQASLSPPASEPTKQRGRTPMGEGGRTLGSPLSDSLSSPAPRNVGGQYQDHSLLGASPPATIPEQGPTDPVEQESPYRSFDAASAQPQDSVRRQQNTAQDRSDGQYQSYESLQAVQQATKGSVLQGRTAGGPSRTAGGPTSTGPLHGVGNYKRIPHFNPAALPSPNLPVRQISGGSGDSSPPQQYQDFTSLAANVHKGRPPNTAGAPRRTGGPVLSGRPAGGPTSGGPTPNGKGPVPYPQYAPFKGVQEAVKSGTLRRAPLGNPTSNLNRGADNESQYTDYEALVQQGQPSGMLGATNAGAPTGERGLKLEQINNQIPNQGGGQGLLPADAPYSDFSTIQENLRLKNADNAINPVPSLTKTIGGSGRAPAQQTSTSAGGELGDPQVNQYAAYGSYQNQKLIQEAAAKRRDQGPNLDQGPYANSRAINEGAQEEGDGPRPPEDAREVPNPSSGQYQAFGKIELGLGSAMPSKTPLEGGTRSSVKKDRNANEQYNAKEVRSHLTGNLPNNISNDGTSNPNFVSEVDPNSQYGKLDKIQKSTAAQLYERGAEIKKHVERQYDDGAYSEDWKNMVASDPNQMPSGYASAKHIQRETEQKDEMGKANTAYEDFKIIQNKINPSTYNNQANEIYASTRGHKRVPTDRGGPPLVKGMSERYVKQEKMAEKLSDEGISTKKKPEGTKKWTDDGASTSEKHSTKKKPKIANAPSQLVKEKKRVGRGPMTKIDKLCTGKYPVDVFSKSKNEWFEAHVKVVKKKKHLVLVLYHNGVETVNKLVDTNSNLLRFPKGPKYSVHPPSLENMYKQLFEMMRQNLHMIDVSSKTGMFSSKKISCFNGYDFVEWVKGLIQGVDEDSVVQQLGSEFLSRELVQRVKPRVNKKQHVDAEQIEKKQDYLYTLNPDRIKDLITAHGSKVEERRERRHWDMKSTLEVFSMTSHKWEVCVVEAVLDPWLMVMYGSGKERRAKWVHRYDLNSIRAPRQFWRRGTKVMVFSRTEEKWHPGVVSARKVKSFNETANEMPKGDTTVETYYGPTPNEGFTLSKHLDVDSDHIRPRVVEVDRFCLKVSVFHHPDAKKATKLLGEVVINNADVKTVQSILAKYSKTKKYRRSYNVRKQTDNQALIILDEELVLDEKEKASEERQLAKQLGKLVKLEFIHFKVYEG